MEKITAQPAVLLRVRARCEPLLAASCVRVVHDKVFALWAVTLEPCVREATYFPESRRKGGPSRSERAYAGSLGRGGPEISKGPGK